MAKVINIYLSKRDKKLIEWANMIRNSEYNLSTWIQMIILCDSLDMEIDVGSVYVSSENKVNFQEKNKTVNTSAMMFGDDEENKKTPKKKRLRRGDKGEYIAGSMITIRITRPAVLGALNKITKDHKKISACVKMILKRYIRESDAMNNILPKNDVDYDLFIVHERTFSKKNYRDFVDNSKKKEIKNSEIQREILPEVREMPNENNKRKNPLLQYI